MSPERRTLRVFAVIAVVVSTITVSSALAGIYLLVERPNYRRLGSLREAKLVRAYLFNAGLRRLAKTLEVQDPRADLFATLWDTDTGVLLSRHMFRSVIMDGAPKYMYKPFLKKLGFRTRASGLHWNMETEDTPAIRAALAELDTPFIVTASYDELGFRNGDPNPASGCAARALFLGDSFTDGLWVGDADTFVSLYGRLVRERSGVMLCPVNAGVNGYGPFEEAFVLEHYFEQAGRPAFVFVMFFANDVDADYDGVIKGTIADRDRRWRDSLAQIARIKRFASSHGATLVLAAIPPAEQVFARSSQENYQNVLRAFSEREGIRFVNLIDRLETTDPHSLYWDWDPHFTPLGHRVVADVLYEETAQLISPASGRHVVPVRSAGRP
jgi:lysophospholipase L1-like esterase